MTTVYAFALIVGRLATFIRERLQRNVANNLTRVVLRQLRAAYNDSKTRLRAVLDAEASQCRPVAYNVDVVAKDYVTAYEREILTVLKSPPYYGKYTLSNFEAVCVVVDIYFLSLGVLAALAYAATEWCAQGHPGSGALTALPIVFAIVCTVVDVIAGAVICHAFRPGAEGVLIRYTQVTFVFLLILAQQVMLLLPMFTFFRELSFVLVFMPLLVVAVAFIFLSNTTDQLCFLAYFGFYSIPSIVLLMLKADNFLGVGTDFLIGDVFPKFSWSLVMIPMWVLLGSTFVFCFLIISFIGDDD